MIETATGLVLRTYPLTETSLIVHWLTPTLGRVATVAKGARRSKSPFRGKLDLWFLADFSFTRSRRSELHNLREVTVRETHVALRHELRYLQQAAYCAGLIELATEAETPLAEIFELLRSMLQTLATKPPLPQTVFAFEIKLLEELGLEPDLEKTRLTDGAKAIVKTLSRSDWPVVLTLRPTAAQMKELRQFLHGFLVFHLGRVPKGRGEATGGHGDPAPSVSAAIS